MYNNKITGERDALKTVQLSDYHKYTCIIHLHDEMRKKDEQMKHLCQLNIITLTLMDKCNNPHCAHSAAFGMKKATLTSLSCLTILCLAIPFGRGHF